MDTTPCVTFFPSAQSRSAGTRARLEERGADYGLHVLKAGEQREPAPPSTCGYGDDGTMPKTLADQLEKGRPAMRRAAAKDAGLLAAQAV